ncbi:MAG: hypothetical protein QY310_16190 [Candidatus Jettenia sp. CY-1]|nr:MAG: hypothetical protein QY310_16190 [Candidatus Jettenia sp. CY-1]
MKSSMKIELKELYKEIKYRKTEAKNMPDPEERVTIHSRMT